MIDTTILFWVAWSATGLLVLSVLLGDLFDFMDFDIGGDTIGAGVLLAFVSIFCFTAGILTNETELSLFICLLLGAVVGGALGFVMMKFLNSLKNSEAGEVGRDGYAGMTGIVTIPVPVVGSGQVRVIAEGHGMDLTAKSNHGVVIPTGTKVEIVDDLGSYNVMVKPVEKVDTPLAEDESTTTESTDPDKTFESN